jgi:hypothetical protein
MSSEGKKSPSPPDDSDMRKHRRSQEVHNRIIGPDRTNRWAWADKMGCSEGAIRQRQGGALPQDLDKVLRILGVDIGIFHNAEEPEWRAYADNLPAGLPPPKPLAPHPSPVLRTPTVLTALQSAEPGSTVVFVLDRKDDTWISDMKGCALTNAERGVSSLFVMHGDPRLLEVLRRLAANPRMPAGSMNIVILPREDPVLLLAKCIILVTIPDRRISKIAMQQIEEEDLTRGFMQSFAAGARIPPDGRVATPDRPLWKPICFDEIAMISDMLRRWCLEGEWL